MKTLLLVLVGVLGLPAVSPVSMTSSALASTQMVVLGRGDSAWAAGQDAVNNAKAYGRYREIKRETRYDTRSQGWICSLTIVVE